MFIVNVDGTLKPFLILHHHHHPCINSPTRACTSSMYACMQETEGKGAAKEDVGGV